MAQTAEEQKRYWLGWCPCTPQRSIGVVIPHEDTIEVSGDSGAGPVRSYSWMNRYLTQTLIFALCMTGVGILLFGTATGDRMAMLGIGIVLATLLYLSDAVHYWMAFETVAKTGAAPEFDWRHITVVKILPVIGVALILAFMGAVLLGLVPGLSLLMINGILAGFAAIGWYHFLTVVLWEKRTNIVLFTRGNQIYRRL